MLSFTSFILQEGLQSLSKSQFSKIGLDKIKELAKVDPTYNPARPDETGSLTVWLLSKYSKILKLQQQIQNWEENKKQGKNFPAPVNTTGFEPEDFETKNLGKLNQLLKKYVYLTKASKTDKTIKVPRIDDIKSLDQLSALVKGVSDEVLDQEQEIKQAKDSENTVENKITRVALDAAKKAHAEHGIQVIKHQVKPLLIFKVMNYEHGAKYFSQPISGNDSNNTQYLTDWCTSRSKSGKAYYDEYRREGGGHYWIILDPSITDPKINNLWQFHFETGQFMDRRDRKVDIAAWFTKHPGSAELFQKLVKEDHPDEEISYPINLTHEVLRRYPSYTYDEGTKSRKISMRLARLFGDYSLGISKMNASYWFDEDKYKNTPCGRIIDGLDNTSNKGMIVGGLKSMFKNMSFKIENIAGGINKYDNPCIVFEISKEDFAKYVKCIISKKKASYEKKWWQGYVDKIDLDKLVILFMYDKVCGKSIPASITETSAWKLRHAVGEVMADHIEKIDKEISK